MSFVSVMANVKNITLVTDGRVTSVEDGSVLNEKFRKYKMISRNQFIAFVGAKETCESVVAQVECIEKDQYDLDKLAHDIHEVITSDDRLKDRDLLFIVGGINSYNKAEFHTINRRTDSVMSYRPKNVDDLNYAYLYTSETDLDIVAKLNELAGRYGSTSLNKRIKIQEALNNFVADHDESVNKTTFILRIQKD